MTNQEIQLPSPRKKLALVIPNQRWAKEDIATTWEINPRFLCVMAAVVEDIVDVEIIDCHHYGLELEDFAEKLSESRPDFVGVSVLTSEYHEILDTAAEVARETLPDSVIIAGGVHVTLKFMEVMENEVFDYACRGEGEFVLRELLLHLMGQGPLPEVGLVYRQDGKLITQNQAYVDDLDELPYPNYDYIQFEDYLNKGDRNAANSVPEYPGTSYTVARGCPCPCTFCHVPVISGKRIRTRSPEKIINELEYMMERYNIKSIIFFDDNFFLAKKQAKALLRLWAERKLPLKWSAAAFAVFALDDEYIDLIGQTNCVTLNIAIESGNKRVLRDLIKKPIKDLDLVPEKIAKIKSKGVNVISNFIIGYPGEKWSEIQDTIRYAEDCGADYVKFFVANPMEGTEMYDMAVEANAVEFKPGRHVPDWRYSKIRSDEWTKKDISILRVYEWDRINFSRDRIEKTAEIWGLTIDEVNEMRKKTRDALSLGDNFGDAPADLSKPYDVCETTAKPSLRIPIR